MRSLIQSLCLVCFLVTVGSTWQFTHIISQIDAAKIIDSVTRTLLIQLLNAETGQRGFIITNDAHYLAPYEAAIAHIQLDLDALGLAADDDREMAPHFIEIKSLVKQKLTELAYTIDLRRTGLQEAVDEVKEHLGKNLMDSLRVHLDSLELKSSADFIEHENAATLYGRIAIISMIFTLISGSFLTFWKR